MARRGKKSKTSFIPDPKRRAYHQARRTIRLQVYHEHEKEFAEAGFLGRMLLRLRIEREIRQRSREIKPPPGK